MNRLLMSAQSRENHFWLFAIFWITILFSFSLMYVRYKIPTLPGGSLVCTIEVPSMGLSSPELDVWLISISFFLSPRIWSCVLCLWASTWNMLLLVSLSLFVEEIGLSISVSTYVPTSSKFFLVCSVRWKAIYLQKNNIYRYLKRLFRSIP